MPEPPAPLRLPLKELVEGAAVEAAGEALALGEAALPLPHPRERGREDARGHDGGDDEQAEEELDLEEPRAQRLAPRGPASRGSMSSELWSIPMPTKTSTPISANTVKDKDAARV